MRGKAEKSGDDYVLNGTKYCIRNAGVADYMAVFATTDPEKQHEGIGAFLVERDWAGISMEKAIPKLGQRCSNIAGISFKNVRFPKENVIAEQGKWFLLAMKTFSRTRPIIGAFVVGTARSAMEFSIDYAKKEDVPPAPRSRTSRPFRSRLPKCIRRWRPPACWYGRGNGKRTAKSILRSARRSRNSTPRRLPWRWSTKPTDSRRLWIHPDIPHREAAPGHQAFQHLRGTSEVQSFIVSGCVLNSDKPITPAMEDLPQIRDLYLNTPSDRLPRVAVPHVRAYPLRR